MGWPRHTLIGARCVELGAGVGVVGILLAKLGARVFDSALYCLLFLHCSAGWVVVPKLVFVENLSIVASTLADSCYGMQVVLTDQPSVLPLLIQNVHQNLLHEGGYLRRSMQTLRNHVHLCLRRARNE